MKCYSTSFNPHVSTLLTIECPYCNFLMDVPVNDPFYTMFWCQNCINVCKKPFVINIAVESDGLTKGRAVVQCLRIEGICEFLSSEVAVNMYSEGIDDFPDDSPVFEGEDDEEK